MGIKLYPTSKNPAADILGQFKVISSIKWLIYFKNGKSFIIINRKTINVSLLDFGPRILKLSHVSAGSKCSKPADWTLDSLRFFQYQHLSGNLPLMVAFLLRRRVSKNKRKTSKWDTLKCHRIKSVAVQSPGNEIKSRNYTKQICRIREWCTE